jgi:hypothetical protein
VAEANVVVEMNCDDCGAEIWGTDDAEVGICGVKGLPSPAAVSFGVEGFAVVVRGSVNGEAGVVGGTTEAIRGGVRVGGASTKAC